MLLAIAVGTAVSCTPSSDADPAPARPTSPVSAVKPTRTFSDAAYAKHLAALRTRLASKQLGHLQIRIEDPFVVIGDGSEEDLAASAQTVRWAADRLEQDFFTHRPTQILDVFLFTRAATYEHGVRALTGSSPSTPYGFYSRHHRGLFMNIATGGGTLVHEIVHPYVEADFPEAPRGSTRASVRCSSRAASAVATSSGSRTGASPGCRSRSPRVRFRRSSS